MKHIHFTRTSTTRFQIVGGITDNTPEAKTVIVHKIKKNGHG